MRTLLSCLLLLISFEVYSNSGSELIYEAQKKDIKLTGKDKEILEIGEISTVRYVTGGILGTYPIGLGIGHAIQGRWSEDGQIFTWGELGFLAVAVTGAIGCIDNVEDGDEWHCSGVESSLIAIGAVGFVGLRIWEIVDVWAVPPSHNSKYKSLKKYIETSEAKPVTKSSLDLVPLVNPRMGQGIGLKYTF